jgi:hypothetical protein
MGGGGADIVGVRNASEPVKNRATTRLNLWISPMASSHSAAVTFSRASHRERTGGSISPSPRSRPRRRPHAALKSRPPITNVVTEYT